MPVVYRFPAWAKETIGSTSPAAVKAYFDERGIHVSDETWRKYLRRQPPTSIVLGLWQDICDAVGVPLSDFIDCQPGPPRPRRRRAGRRKPTRSPIVKPSRRPPPRPADFFGDFRA